MKSTKISDESPLHAAARAWPLPLGIAALTLVWFALLGGRALYEPDEGRYAELPREMLHSHDWVIPHLNGLVYLEKPPLQYWLTASSFAALGENEFSARLCTGLAGYLTLGLSLWVGRRLWNRDVGVRAVLLTAAAPLWVLMGHQLTLDMLLSCCLFASLACFLVAQDERDKGRSSGPWMLGCWTAMALAVLAKGLVGVVIPLATLVIYVLWQRDRAVLRSLNLRWGVPLFLAIALPWFVMAARANPDFLRFFFIREHFQRYLTPIEHRTEAWWFFLLVLTVGILPWVPQALRATLASLRHGAAPGRFDPARVLCVWSLFIVGFFSLSDAKLIPYILPVIPALALLCASRPPGAEFKSLAIGAAVSLAACAGILGYASAHWGAPDSHAVQLQARPMLMGTAALLAVAACATLAFARTRPEAALVVLCTGWFAASCGVLLAADAAQGSFSAKQMALDLRSSDPTHAPVFSVQVYDQSLPFYLGRTVTLVAYQDEFALGLAEQPRAAIATLEEFSARWRRSNIAFAVMRTGTHDLLLAQGLPMRDVERSRDRILVARR